MENQVDILLVEDTPSDIRLTEEALKRSDMKYSMSVAHDGVEAMELLAKLKGEKKLPSIILLDLNMPRKNGHEVLAEIKADSELTKIPVVLLTVSQRDEDVMEALKLKMNYYIAKPVTWQKLSVLVKAIHELHTADPERAHSEEETHVRLILASNPHTSPMVLAKLADDEDQRVRSRVAENEQVPYKILAKLANDKDPDVRSSVCENVNVPADLLEKLSADPSEDVRLAIAGNLRVPTHILKALASDSNTYVSSSASKTLAQVK